MRNRSTKVIHIMYDLGRPKAKYNKSLSFRFVSQGQGQRARQLSLVTVEQSCSFQLNRLYFLYRCKQLLHLRYLQGQGLWVIRLHVDYLTITTLNYLLQYRRAFFSIWNHHKYFVRSFRFIEILLWVYDNNTYFNSFSEGVVFIRQNLRSTDVRFWRIKTGPSLKGLINGCRYVSVTSVSGIKSAFISISASFCMQRQTAVTVHVNGRSYCIAL